MRQALPFAQIIISTILVILVLLQSQSGGLGATWGGGGGETYHTRKGIEKVIFIGTIIGVVLFILISITNLML